MKNFRRAFVVVFSTAALAFAFGPAYAAAPQNQGNPNEYSRGKNDQEYSENRQPLKQAESAKKTVYVSKNGKQYHIKNCRNVGKNSRAISKAEAVKAGYKPCNICKPDKVK